MREIKISSNEEGKRLDKFLNQYFPNAGAGFLYKMLRKKNITLNKKKATGKEVLSDGDCISVFFSDDTFYKFANEHVKRLLSTENTSSSHDDSDINNENIQADNKINDNAETTEFSQYKKAYRKFGSLEIIFENSDILLLNKPTGILSQKAEGGDLSINEWLIGYLIENSKVSKESLATFRPSVCNRLDRNTSGIIICSKSLKGAREMARVLKDRSLKKYYYALVCGTVTEDADIEGFLVKDEKTNKVTLYKDEDSIKKALNTASSINGKTKNKDNKVDKIKTSYHVISSASINPLKNPDNKPANGNRDTKVTLLEVLLHTGKTHQIRAHLSSIDHPIVGDTKYGKKGVNEIFKSNYKIRNQLLHARRLVFPDNMEIDGLSGKEFVAKPEKEFEDLIETFLK